MQGFRRPRRVGLTLVAAIAAALVTAGIAAAFNSGGNPGVTGPNTITWTGQGTTNGSVDTVQCDSNNTGYLVWILTVDGGSIQSDSTTPVLHLGGTGSGDYYTSNPSDNSSAHFVTPYFDPSGLTASADMNVLTTGKGSWNLVISHGCPGGPPPAGAPTLIKTASQNADTEYSWTINKAVDKSEIDVTPPNSATFNYTVTVSHDGGTIHYSDVTGDITVFNGNAGDILLDSVTDVLSDTTNCTVDTSGGLTIPAGGSADFPYTCGLTGYPGDYPNTTNTATITWSDQTLTDGTFLAGDSKDYTVPVDFTTSISDNCANVTDTFTTGSADQLGYVCVGDDPPASDLNGSNLASFSESYDGTSTFTFNYSRTIAPPTLGTCQTYDNKASFADNSTPQNTGDASKTVTVCNFNAPLTIGYWKTHMYQCPAHTKVGTNGCNNNGPFTSQFLGNTICTSVSCPSGVLVGTLGNYYADNTTKALAVFNANNCSNASTADSNAAGCLAAQLLGAELNVAHITNPCICPTIKSAIAALKAVGYNGPGSAITLLGSGYTRNDLITLKTALDNYNNGLGCP